MNMLLVGQRAAALSKPRLKPGSLPTQAAARPTVPEQRALTQRPYANGGNKKTQGRSPGLLTVRHIGIGLIALFLFDKFGDCPNTPSYPAHEHHKSSKDGKEYIAKTIPSWYCNSHTNED